jgi:hypothetical protein
VTLRNDNFQYRLFFCTRHFLAFRLQLALGLEVSGVCFYRQSKRRAADELSSGTNMDDQLAHKLFIHYKKSEVKSLLYPSKYLKTLIIIKIGIIENKEYLNS